MAIGPDLAWFLSLFDREFAYALATVFAGGVIMGFGGFGSGLVLMPLLTLIYSPTHAVAIQMVLVTITGFAFDARRDTAYPLAGGGTDADLRLSRHAVRQLSPADYGPCGPAPRHRHRRPRSRGHPVP